MIVTDERTSIKALFNPVPCMKVENDEVSEKEIRSNETEMIIEDEQDDNFNLFERYQNKVS